MTDQKDWWHLIGKGVVRLLHSAGRDVNRHSISGRQPSTTEKPKKHTSFVKGTPLQEFISKKTLKTRENHVHSVHLTQEPHMGWQSNAGYRNHPLPPRASPPPRLRQLPPHAHTFRSTISGNGTWEPTFWKQNQPTKTNTSLKTTYQKHKTHKHKKNPTYQKQ